MAKGLFFSFEGIEGCGKSTQVELFGHHLASRFISYQITIEPGGTPLGLGMRHLLLSLSAARPTAETELFLYMADRAQHVSQVIIPSLEQGLVVVCDRYADSTTAYQGYGRGLSLKLINELNQLATRGLEPHLTFLLDLSAEAGLQRAVARGAGLGVEQDRMEREALEFHRRVRAGFLEIAALHPDRIKVLDAAAPPETLAAQIQELAAPYLDRMLT